MVGMDTNTKQIIDSLGGDAEVARLLGYDPKRGGVQRVNNWKRRGIPLHVLLERPDLFPKPTKKAA